MNDTSLLVVEDDANDEVLTLRTLKKDNFVDKVFVVRDGAEALDFMFCRNNYADRDPSDLPRLILLDLKLPKVNGLEVLQRIRADERTRQVPVVLFSSSDEQKDLIEGLKSGANSYVRKPVDSAQYMEFIKLLGSYWMRFNRVSPNISKY
jgi:two-component system response regulator